MTENENARIATADELLRTGVESSRRAGRARRRAPPPPATMCPSRWSGLPAPGNDRRVRAVRAGVGVVPALPRPSQQRT